MKPHPALVSLLVALQATSPSASAATDNPELEALRAPYTKNLAAIAAYRESRAEPIRRFYTGAVERLEKDVATRGQVEVAEAAKAERERVTANKEPTAAERAKMPAALAALRSRYEKDMEPLNAQIQQQEQKQARQYLDALEMLQRRLTTTNQIEKSAQVARERAAIAALLPTRNALPRESTAVASTVRAKGKLDPELADKIAAAVKSKSHVRTEKSGDDGDQGGGADIPEDGALLVGFELMELPSDKGAWIRSLRPYFLTREGVVPGKDRGKVEKITNKVLAREGYAVAGLLSLGSKQGLQIIFMKVDPLTGRYDSSPAATYKSKWFGTKIRGTPKQLGGDGRLVIGVYGDTGADCDNLGLVQMP